MITYHVYKIDCSKSSRVMLQSKWDEKSIFVHLGDNILKTEGLDDISSYKLSFKKVFNLALETNNSEPTKWIFHEQAGLPYLVLFRLINRIRGIYSCTMVYDMHDLHERVEYKSIFKKIRYDFIRYHLLGLLEKVVFNDRAIKKVIVSDGLARIVAKRYKTKNPTVVKSACNTVYSAQQLAKFNRDSKAIIYFGALKHSPLRLIDYVQEAGLELHFFGRDINAVSLGNKLGRPLPNCVKYFGEYTPSNLKFLTGYRYLIMYHPDNVKINYRYSLPNKIFQAISHGISVIVSNNFEEMIKTFKNVPGAVKVLHSPNDLKSCTQELENLQSGSYWTEITNLASRIHDESRQNYLNL